MLKQSWNSKVDLIELKSNIVYLVNQEEQILTNFTAILIADIPELLPKITNHLL